MTLGSLCGAGAHDQTHRSASLHNPAPHAAQHSTEQQQLTVDTDLSLVVSKWQSRPVPGAGRAPHHQVNNSATFSSLSPASPRLPLLLLLSAQGANNRCEGSCLSRRPHYPQQYGEHSNDHTHRALLQCVRSFQLLCWS